MGGFTRRGFAFCHGHPYNYIYRRAMVQCDVYWKDAIMATKQTKIDRAVHGARSVVKSALTGYKRQQTEARDAAAMLRCARYVVVQPALTRIHMLTDSIPETQRHISVTMWGNRPEIMVSLYEQDSLKSDVIEALLEYASEVCPDKAQSRDYVGKDWGERAHTFYGPGLSIRVAINVKSDGECKKILKGTKMVQQDEYMFVCPE